MSAHRQFPLYYEDTFSFSSFAASLLYGAYSPYRGYRKEVTKKNINQDKTRNYEDKQDF